MAIYWCSNASGQRTRSNIAHTKNMFYSEASIPVRATPKCEKNHRQFVSSSRILCVTCDTPAAMSGRAGEEKITRKWRNLEMMNVLSSFYTKSRNCSPDRGFRKMERPSALIPASFHSSSTPTSHPHPAWHVSSSGGEGREEEKGLDAKKGQPVRMPRI